MSIQKKYLLTAVMILAVLTGAVAAARAFHFMKPGGAADNLKYKGPQNARVSITIYSDFQCPACQRAHAPLEALQKEFANDVRVEFRHFPLEHAHRWAMTAALFAECSADQGKFWEMHDRLFSEQPKWSVLEDAVPELVRYAGESGLNLHAFEVCLADPKTLERVRRDKAMGDHLQVQSTPTIFINGQRLIGAMELEQKGKGIIEEALKKS